jgi:glyoxylase-like metal-dependent hydrolase (beta-lactamase superfamily II)
MGPAHAPGDSIMVIKEIGVLFSGDVIYKGRIPFLDSPDTDIGRWLEGLAYLENMQPTPRFIIPGHGDASDDVHEAISFTQGYLKYVREKMREAADNFVPFSEAYENTDWSKYRDMPAFDASNRGNAYRIYLEMEVRSFK